MLDRDWFMMFPENYTWSGTVLNAIASSYWEGAEMGEIYKVCFSLKDKVGNWGAWFSAWNEMAEKVAALGEKAEKEGHIQTASAAYMRAGHYIQLGERLLQPRTPESQKAFARSVALFKKGAPHYPFLSIEPVEIPFEKGTSLPGYFVKRKDSPTDTKWPTVVFFDGLDGTKEMHFFKGVPELIKRGMACLVLDGPGTGECIRFRGMHLRYDYDVAGTATVNYLETRKDVNKDRLAVMGVSLGGYYAPRCAAFEKRFKACVAWGATYDYHATWKKRIESGMKASLSVPGDHIKWILGVDSFDEALKKLENFTLKGVADKIQCSFLLLHGEADEQVPMLDAQKQFDEVGAKDKTFKVFNREEGGAQHCTKDNHTIGTAYFSDWLADRLVR
jgi:dienelactone hydrolase